MWRISLNFRISLLYFLILVCYFLVFIAFLEKAQAFGKNQEYIFLENPHFIYLLEIYYIYLSLNCESLMQIMAYMTLECTKNVLIKKLILAMS